MVNNKILTITPIDNGLQVDNYECNCGLPQEGFRFMFKDIEDMELFIKFFKYHQSE